MKKPSFLLLINCLLATFAMAQTGYWQQQANYKIDVQLNDTTNLLTGNETIEYINNSPDTLRFLWVHLWPNAYKNDKTAYSEQKLLGDNTDFYFSDSKDRGYINRLAFTANGEKVKLEDTVFIDMVKVLLPKPLLPGGKLTLETPFHVKLPYLFSRLGHTGNFYSITQWYPKIATYDKNGWHQMPYLEWGEYYNDFGNYDVSVTLPKNYVVAATGVLDNEAEKTWMKSRTTPVMLTKPSNFTPVDIYKKTAPKAIVDPAPPKEQPAVNAGHGKPAPMEEPKLEVVVVKTDTTKTENSDSKKSWFAPKTSTKKKSTDKKETTKKKKETKPATEELKNEPAVVEYNEAADSAIALNDSTKTTGEKKKSWFAPKTNTKKKPEPKPKKETVKKKTEEKKPVEKKEPAIVKAKEKKPKTVKAADTAVVATKEKPAKKPTTAKKKTPAKPIAKRPPVKKKELFPTAKNREPEFPPSDKETKTLHFTASNITDFAWFADKRFLVKYDTIQLNGQVVEAWNFILPKEASKWALSMDDTKKAIRFYSNELGNYPHPQVSVLPDATGYDGGMEYPMITMLDANDSLDLEGTIAHEIGHNWLQGIIATNERQHPWMDEGMNTYYEKKYIRQFVTPIPDADKPVVEAKQPEDKTDGMLALMISKHKDQPIETPSENLTQSNYSGVVYAKAAQWMEELEKIVGTEKMKQLMQAYYNTWKFKHPEPADFKAIAEKESGKSLTEHFNLLTKTGALQPPPIHPKTKLTFLYNFNNKEQANYIGIAPAIGFNNYDKLELGLLLHNYNLPAKKFQFVVAPMFATNSKQFVGMGRVGYTWYPKKNFYKAEVYASAARFNFDNGRDLQQDKVYKSFAKVTPGIYLELKSKHPTTTFHKYIDLKAWFISEQEFELKSKPLPADTNEYYFAKGGNFNTVIPQITFGVSNERSLYPWKVELAVQNVKQIVRTTLTANYFLNYNAKDQGVAVRVFLGKIFYTETKTDQLRAENSRYHFTLYTSPNNGQDYTYSNVFADRNQSTEIFGRQIMIRDGGFKYRSDFSSVQPGLKTDKIDFFDNWMATANIVIDVPNKLNPVAFLKLPLKIFVDAGTSASPWEVNSPLPKFLYSMGLQLPLFKCLNVYYPLIQSKEFKEPNSVNNPNRAGGPTWWQKRLTFSIDINALKPKKAGETIL